MKPFHYHTPYFKLGPFRVQMTIVHVNGPHWNGQPSGLKNPFTWIPKFFRYEQKFCGFLTVSRGVVFGMLAAVIDICDTRIKA